MNSQLSIGTNTGSAIGTKQIRMRLTLKEIRAIAEVLKKHDDEVPFGLTRRFLCAADNDGYYSRR